MHHMRLDNDGSIHQWTFHVSCLSVLALMPPGAFSCTLAKMESYTNIKLFSKWLPHGSLTLLETVQNPCANYSSASTDKLGSTQQNFFGVPSLWCEEITIKQKLGNAVIAISKELVWDDIDSLKYFKNTYIPSMIFNCFFVQVVASFLQVSHSPRGSGATMLSN